MRKTIVTLVALCAAMAVHATVLRVSNVSGSTAPYSTVQAAMDAAMDGDTIILDASATSYGGIKIEKRVVVIGAGFWLQENGIAHEGGNYTRVDGVSIQASGAVVCGLYSNGMDSNFGIAKNCTEVVIKRCRIGGKIAIGRNADRCVIHQNFIKMHSSFAVFGDYAPSSNHQITNNIFSKPNFGFGDVTDSYFAYNTILGEGTIGPGKSNTFEYNIWYNKPEDTTCNFGDNLVMETSFDVDKQTDKDVQAMNLSSTHGAFAGDSPYVISGIPSAPIIEDLVVPTTVEYGSNMNVTIKLNIQK